jgi:hypothetical protein
MQAKKEKDAAIVNLILNIQLLVFMWRSPIPKLKITNPSEILVSSDIRPSRNLTFYNVLARQGSSFCNRARLNVQAFALRDIKMAAREGLRVGQKMNYRLSFGQLNIPALEEVLI